MKRYLIALLSAPLIVFLLNTDWLTAQPADEPLAAQASLGTGFTYQGSLSDGDRAANGSYDFVFTLYDAASGGAQVGSTVTRESVPVVDGFFTVMLDFGDGTLSGESRWLEVGVRPGGGNPYATLSPRQELTPVPYAVYAANAAWNGLVGVPGGFRDNVDDDALSALACGGGQIVEWNRGAWVCGTDDVGAGDVAWSLNGNSGTSPGTDFIGTIDDQPFAIRANNFEALRVTADRNVGIGTSNPQARLDVAGNVRLTAPVGVSSWLVGVEGDSFAGTGWYVIKDLDSNANRLVIDQNTGDVGIGSRLGVGTSNPAARLEVQAGNNNRALFATIAGTGTAVHATATGDGRAADFRIEQVTNGETALLASTTGLGRAGGFQIDNPNSTEPAVFAYSNGGGGALYARTTGDGAAVTSLTEGKGEAGYFEVDNPAAYGPALRATIDGASGSVAVRGENTNGRAAQFQNASAWATLEVTNNGNGAGLRVVNDGTHSNPRTGATISAYQSGTGWIAYLQGNGVTNKGVYISAAQDQPGLQVVGGSKNAVVGTSDGARALYTEEATEVWFADYGFGQLQEGRATIHIDPIFAETVNLDEPYHVFVQMYDAASAGVAVVNRTATAFEVVELNAGRSNAEFSYRIVARRLGMEALRLERAPWADGDANLQASQSE